MLRLARHVKTRSRCGMDFYVHRRKKILMTQPLTQIIRQRSMCARVNTNERRFTSSALMSDCFVQNVDIAQEGQTVRVAFSDGSTFDFHGMWLRDACQDGKVFSEKGGERYLERTPVATKCQGKVSLGNIVNGNLELFFDEAHEALAGQPMFFSSSFLRMYGPIVGKPVDTSSLQSRHPAQDAYKWLEAYTNFDRVPAPNPSLKTVWKNEGFGLHRKYDQFQHRDYNQVLSSDAANLEMLQTLMEYGVLILDGVPAVDDSSIVRGFSDDCLGGLQKDPVRDAPNWVIKRNDTAASSAYTYHRRLNNHTDQAPAPHGMPGLLVIMHYLRGTGVNTLVDGYAVVEAMRERDPDALHMLSTFGVCHQRDFIQSRVDFRDSFRRVSQQRVNQSLLINAKKPIIQLDNDGHVIRVQYNEVSRTPSTVPFEKFPEWYRAYRVWNDMIHNSEFEVELPLQAGQILLIDNWRVLHGRAANACSPDRLLMGGTVLREGFYSKAIQLSGACYPVAEYAGNGAKITCSTRV